MKDKWHQQGNVLYTIGILTVSFATAALTNDASSKKTPHLYETPAERRNVAGIVLREGISIGGLIEIEASAGKEDGGDVSDIILATLELGVEAELNEWVRGRVLLLWEEDDTEPVDLDEAIAILGGGETFPAYIKTGKMYVPFGTFNSHFISDPLTQELAETRESAVVIGFSNNLLDIRAGAFNGDADETSDEATDAVGAFALNLGCALQIGGYWISHIGESDTLEEAVCNSMVHGAVNGTEYNHPGGAGGFASIRIGRFVADAEYITAIEAFGAETLHQTESKPNAWNIETGIRFDPYDAEVAFKYEGSDEFPGFPKAQYGMGSSLRISPSATLAIEYLHGTFTDETKARDSVTAQLAMEF